MEPMSPDPAAAPHAGTRPPGPASSDEPGLAQVRARLAAAPTFARIDPASLARIAEASRIETGETGRVFFSQGELGTFAFLVLDGEVSIDVATDAGEVTVAVLGPGELVGEIAAFAATPRTATVRARTAVRLLRIEQAVVRSVLAADPEAAMAIIGELGRRLQNLNSTFAVLTDATNALAEGRFEPAMLDTLRRQADRYAHFAGVFDHMAREIDGKRRFAQEMRMAAEIQRALLPGDPGTGGSGAPDPRARIAATMLPATHVGGDFYDWFAPDGRHLAAVVGDVSGKGVPAALFMAVARTVLRTVGRESLDPARLLERANAILSEDNREAMFVTVACAVLDLATGEVAIASGGHEEVYVLRCDGSVEKIGPMGRALGLFPGGTFGLARTRLAPGERVVLATDGITEAFAPDRSLYGEDRLIARLAAAAADPGPDADGGRLLAALLADVAAFADGAAQSDDITCLLLGYAGAAG